MQPSVWIDEYENDAFELLMGRQAAVSDTCAVRILVAARTHLMRRYAGRWTARNLLPGEVSTVAVAVGDPELGG